ncbi:GNAT family N-acetyltransferase [Alteromonas oceanisediminis]|uniref:GNAT family N-acetyltransferase n=1 Tax=Alteromonas oceanisediminis TaxID=2836180 RepID=UPI001BD9E4E2|nr:GNAT family N-acetyltransferase [Alteromonas oceanisediminis]MBT0586967.1 GNAT family N-acetyltransferase [Alteromonas oceanisediminis]
MASFNTDYNIVLPTRELEASYNAYIVELGDEERYPFVMDFEQQPFQSLITRLQDLASGKVVPEGAVVNHTYWLVEQEELVGVGNVRPKLNPAIARIGGHIGFGIRPRYRNQGLGSYFLAQLVEKAREHGVSPIHLHCHASNTASSKVIESVGGELESHIEDAHQGVIRRYVVHA